MAPEIDPTARNGAAAPPARRPAGTALAALAALAIAAAPAGAATFTIDHTTPGTLYDGVVDGFPGIAPQDGVPDVPGNALGVALKDGVTEERGLAELSLAPLRSAGVTAAQVATAVLTFNIDDVLSTFGPGTEFDGTASEEIVLFLYGGDGALTTSDFQLSNDILDAVAVRTGGAGITDATLAVSGPVRFEIDVTAVLRAILDGDETHLGITFTTNDSPTGTSLDDLGLNGVGPPGAGGARLPFLTVTTAAAATPTPIAPTPTPAPTATATAAPTATALPSAAPTPGPSATALPTQTASPTATPVPGATPTPTPVIAPTGTPSSTPGATGTPAPSGSPAATPTTAPGATPTRSPSATASPTPARTPTPAATRTPAPSPTRTPSATPTGAPRATPAAGLSADVPAGVGDQLVFPIDARDEAVTFLNLRNEGTDAIAVRLLAYGAASTYGAAGGAPVEQRFGLAASASRTIDGDALRAAGLPAGLGIAVAFAVDGDGAPIATAGLSGSFTIADLTSGAAWGAPAAARRAVVRSASGVRRARPGDAIDGRFVVLQRIQPSAVGLPVYYDPAQLSPPHGASRLLFLAFADAAGGAISPAAATWRAAANRRDGSALPPAAVEVSGVRAGDLTAILGTGASGAAGGARFALDDPGDASHLVYFSMSLDAFAAGYLLPSVSE